MKFGKGRIPSTQSRATHNFASVPTATIPRSVFNRSHGYKSTFNEGYLVPVYVDEVLPGDTFNMRMTAFARLSTPIFPIMDNLYMDIHFWYCPARILWSNWEKMCGAQDNPADSTNFITPVLDDTTAPLNAAGFATGSLFDYFGLPTLIPSSGAGDFPISALPFRMYNLLYNQWYRDQNLQNSVTVQLTNGPDNCNLYTLLQRGKRHDYFTSCLPWPQKVNDGSTLNVPLGGTANIIPNPVQPFPYFVEQGVPANVGTIFTATAGAQPVTKWNATATGGLSLEWDAATGASHGTGLIADLSTATGVTINELREAFQIQKMFERDARSGTRYTEIVHAHFGVVSPDGRLQRVEFLGGGSSPVGIHPVPQTSVSAATPQGNLAAFGTLSANAGFVKSFTEHGFILGIVNVRADLNYMQGTNRMWSRSTRYDYFWPALSHIGEQAVLNKEIYIQADGNAAHDLGVFGYNERHAEYRYKPGQITGLFRANAVGTLDAWHLAQSFGALPALNATFIVENAPMSRILAVNSAPHFLFDAFFDLKCARPMPTYAVPGLIDHF